MPHSFKLARRIARLRAPLVAGLILTIVGCNSADSVNPDSSTPTIDPASSTGAGTVSVAGPEMATTKYAGGIPFGLFHQPNEQFGSRYNGALRNISPPYLLSNLAAIKARGGKVALMMAGNENNYKDSQGHFDMGKWKARIDRYKNVNFDSYVADGTIIGHYLIDEPYDPVNWRGKPVPGSVIDQMAQYSKQLWPSMTTIVRAEPAQVGSGPFRYLDAAWAQYTYKKGDAKSYISRNVSDAQRRGLELVVGLAVTAGSVNGVAMSASQVQAAGSTLLSSSYPCAFIMWQYSSSYVSSSAMQKVMDLLSSEAKSRSSKSCKG